MHKLFVIVSGTPGSGKSTLARALASALGMPLIMKDTIKEALGDEFIVRSVEDSQRLGAATMRVLFALMADNEGGVFESTWYPAMAKPQLAELRSPIVEVFCEVPLDVAISRFEERSPSRHAVHAEGERALTREGFAERAEPIDGGWPVVRLDTTQDVDADALAREVLARV